MESQQSAKAGFSQNSSVDEEQVPFISIIIGTHNNLGKLKDCIASIYANSDDQSTFEIIVIDCSSADGTGDYLADQIKQYKNFKVILSQADTSYSRACNLGIKSSTGTFTALVNDSLTLPPGWKSSLLSHFQSDDQTAIAGCLIVNESGQICHSGVNIGSLNSQLYPNFANRLRNQEFVEDAAESRTADAVGGGLLVFRMDAFLSTGFLDEEYKTQLSDFDFCLRAKKAGHKIIYCGDVCVVTSESLITPKTSAEEHDYTRFHLLHSESIEATEDDITTQMNVTDIILREKIMRDPHDQKSLDMLNQIAQKRNSLSEADYWRKCMEELNDSKEKPKPLISVILLNSNMAGLICESIDSLGASTKIEHEFLVVDCGSDPADMKMLREFSQNRQNVQILFEDNSPGDYKKINRAIGIAEGKYICLLETGLKTQSEWAENAINKLRDESPFLAITGKVTYPDARIKWAGVEYIRPEKSFGIIPRTRHFEQIDDYSEAQFSVPVSAFTRHCSMFGKDVLQNFGGFDETFKDDYADYDLSMRILQSGKDIAYLPAFAFRSKLTKQSAEEQGKPENIDDYSLFYHRWAKYISSIQLATFIANHKGNTIYLSKEIIPVNPDDLQIAQFQELFRYLDPFYLHVGGTSSALLMLSEANATSENKVIVSMARSTDILNSFFKLFPQIKKIYYLPWVEDEFERNQLISTLGKLENIKGSSLSLKDNNIASYIESLEDLESRTSFNPHPDWIKTIPPRRLEEFQVVISPRGYVGAEYGWTANRISSVDWRELVIYLNTYGIKPVIIGTPSEINDFPVFGEAHDCRSYSHTDQAEIICGSDLFVGADNWAKLVMAMRKLPTIVFRPATPLNHDNTERVNKLIWDTIIYTENLEQFRDIFKSFITADMAEMKPREVVTSFSERFWKRNYPQAKTVLVKVPQTIKGALIIASIVRELAGQYPHLKIYVTGNDTVKDIFMYHPDVKDVLMIGSLEYSTIETIADIIIDYENVIGRFPEYYNVISYMDILGNVAGIKFTNKDLFYTIDDEEDFWAEFEVAKIRNKDDILVGMQLSTPNDFKRSYPYGSQLITELQRAVPNMKFLLLGREELGAGISYVYDCGVQEIPLRRQIALAKHCDAFLTIDSAFFHLAHNLFNKPSMVIAGATNPSLIGNADKGFAYVRNDKLECLECYGQKKCNIECMWELHPQEIVKRFLGLLADKVPAFVIENKD